MIKLYACPNCEGAEIDMVPVRMWGKTMYMEMCKGCGARTEVYPTREEAIRAWNRRHINDSKDGMDRQAGEDART